ncbi:MAG: hypothetical protein LBK42_10370 [Propionibacteriaceae bacterium]|jgi:hypothetical protein|nr:hypothetical protein [Propionibacteriaceae bacterium]
MGWWEAVEGDPDETDLLVAALERHPRSMYRAARLRDTPHGGDDDRPLRLDWYGLDDLTILVARIHNMLAKRGRVLGPETAPDDDELRQAVFTVMARPD